LKYHANGLQIAAAIREVVTNGVRMLSYKRHKAKRLRPERAGVGPREQ
jgi:hypothetical protein